MAGPFKLDNQYANYAGHWLANNAYAQGKRVIAESANVGDARKYVFECTTAGTSADPGPPTWVITPGNTTSDGTVTWTCREATTWANAHGRIKWICLRPAAGEIIHVDDSHTETLTASETWAFNGTQGSSVNVICVDKATDDAVAGYASGATITGASSYHILITGECTFWGMTIRHGADSYFKNDDFSILFENCKLITNGICRLYGQNNVLINTDVEFVTSSSQIRSGGSRPNSVIWKGGSTIGDPAVMIYLWDGYRVAVEIIGIDASSVVGGSLIDLRSSTNNNSNVVLKGIKLNASPPDLLTSFTPSAQTAKVILDIADNGSTVYKFRREYQGGYAQDETIKVITGKALYDGTNEFTAKMVSRATPTANFYDPWRYHLTTLRETGFAASRTYTVHIAQDHADTQPDALNDDEIWLEVVYPDDSTAQYNIKTDKIATPTTTPAAQTTSTETWAGLAATTRLQELSVQIDAADGKNGPVEIWVCLAKESKTVYVCPEVYVS